MLNIHIIQVIIRKDQTRFIFFIKFWNSLEIINALKKINDINFKKHNIFKIEFKN